MLAFFLEHLGMKRLISATYSGMDAMDFTPRLNAIGDGINQRMIIRIPPNSCH